MKKILFLTYNYPYGHFGPSDNCSLRIMKALLQSGYYEVHNISYSGDKKNYDELPGVILHDLGFPEKTNNCPSWLKRILLMLKLTIYPFTDPLTCYRLYKATKVIIKKEKFDLVIAQHNPGPSVWAGVWLKKYGFIDRLGVIFWDSIYGKIPRRVVPKAFALKRQRRAETIIARHANSLVSLYPLRKFHEENGEIPEAKGKRVYLGIPSIAKPPQMPESSYKDALKEGSINILYSGTIFRTEYVAYLVRLLNQISGAERLNLIFFSKGVSDEDFARLKCQFKGTIYSSPWIKLNELLALYPHIDFFLSFPGNPTAIRSKVFEYMSYGKPLLLLYDDDKDVNIHTFSKYPANLAIDERKDPSHYIQITSDFLKEMQGKNIPFDDVEKLFPEDTVSAYVSLINKLTGV